MPRKYREIADVLRERIDAGDFPPGSRLPAERALTEEYGVAQGTIRQALAVLRDEGITESRVGSGVYVRTWRPIVRNALQRLRSEQWGQGKYIWDVDVEDRDFEVVNVQIENLGASGEAARALGLEEGDLVWRRSRLYAVDGVPVMAATSHIPDEFGRGTAITRIDTGDGGIYARLRDAGHGPVRFREELRCRMPSAIEVDELQLLPATPVVDILRIAYAVDERAVEVNRMVLDASKYLLVYDFSA